MFLTQDVEKLRRHILFPATFLSKKPALNEIRWKNVVEPDRPQMTI
jgi:hypothetical protein